MNNWRLERTEVEIETRWIEVRRNSYLVGEGAEIEDYFVIRRPDFVMVVATWEGRLVMVRQYRPGTDREYLSLPGGYIDAGEEAMAAGLRELREETGFIGGECRRLGELDPFPAYLRSKAWLVRCEAVPGEGATPDGVEVNEVCLLTWEEALAGIRSGAIDEMQAVCAILLAREMER